MKLNEQQLASLSSPKAVKEFLVTQKENITSIIKQNLAVGDIFKRENLQVRHSYICNLFYPVIYVFLINYEPNKYTLSHTFCHYPVVPSQEKIKKRKRTILYSHAFGDYNCNIYWITMNITV